MPGGAAGEIIQVGAICAAIAAILALARSMWRGAKRAKRAADYIEALHDIATYQLRPNSGGSLVDGMRWLRDWTVEHDLKHSADTDELWAVLARHGIDRRSSPPVRPPT